MKTAMKMIKYKSWFYSIKNVKDQKYSIKSENKITEKM